MNYSYVMGIDNINKLKEENFEIQQFGNSFGVVFSDEKIKLFEEYICKSLKNGFWNEYLGKDKVFIFKFKNGEIKRYVLNEDNEQEILKLCCEFASYEFESIDKMLRENEFYAENYYNKYCMDSIFIDFLISAKKGTYANSTVEKVDSNRLGSSDYHYETNIKGNNYIYHDTYFGGTKFMGEEVVYCNSNKPIWGMNYYGLTLDKTLGENAIDNALRLPHSL